MKFWRADEVSNLRVLPSSSVEFLRKPFTASELIAAVGKMLSSAAASTEGQSLLEPVHEARRHPP